MATAFHEPISRVPADLQRLNEAERRVLRLLAEGHTAKSIATAIDSTPAAVNERLREARRKTGVGSSRELARLLRAQENRHEQMGVGRTGPIAARPPEPAAEGWRPQVGVLGMIALFAVVAAGAAALMSQQPSATNEADPLFASIFAEQDPMKLFASRPKNETEMDRALAGEGFHSMLRQLHAKVHSEPRDPAWASSTESSLRGALASIPRIGAPGTELRILCATSLCEIAGTVETPPDGSNRAVLDEFNSQTMSRLNPHALEPETDRLRLKTMLGGIATMSQKPPRLSYVFYYSRKK